MTAIEESINLKVKKVPLLLKIISTIIIVEGVLGFLFYTGILIYYFIDPLFISNWGYGQFSGSFLVLILLMYSILHFGLVLSAYYLLNLNKKGIYLILLSIIILLATGFLLHNSINWLGLIAAFFVLILLSYYVKSFT